MRRAVGAVLTALTLSAIGAGLGAITLFWLAGITSWDQLGFPG